MTERASTISVAFKRERRFSPAVAPPLGQLKGERVLVKEERDASTLYNKGAFGVPQTGGSLALDLAEALYLVEMGRLRVEDAGERAGPGELLAVAARAEPGFEVRYVVYRDLRQRSLTVRASNVSDFNVYDPGAIPGKSPSKLLVRAVGERSTFRAVDVTRESLRARELGKRFVLALVDEEGDLTYYDVDGAPPAGHAPPAKRDLSRAEPALLLADRVVAAEAGTVAALAGPEHLGHALGPLLQLSLAEAVWLVEEAALRVRSPEGKELMTADTLRAFARSVQPDFDLRYRAFRDLKARGLVVKTGFKFGTHLRAYKGAVEEEHAPYLVHALAAGVAVPWPEIAGFVRLAHGVRKDVLFATVGESVDYLRLRRTKP